MAQLRCVVERITYQNEENGYTVLKVKSSGRERELFTVVGNFGDINIGCVLLIEGMWKTDAKFGRQFVAGKWEETMPATIYGLEKYLGSGLIKGIGPKFAKRIVEKFGTDTIAVIEDTPDKLLEVEGIGTRRIDMIKQSWDKQKEIKNIMIFLQEYDVSTSYAAKIFKTYGNDSIRIVKENPYRLADDIWGIGFRTADRIASKLGAEKDSYERLRSGILYALGEMTNDGHVFAMRTEIISAACELLECDTLKIERALAEMAEASDVMEEADAVYLPSMYACEKGTAEKLTEIFSGKDRFEKTEPVKFDLDRLEKLSGISFDEVQADAIKTASVSKIMVLTGGPGTGKTTTTLGIIKMLQSAGMHVLLAAPTGRAARRMTEATGIEAKTIHRLLEYQPQGGYQRCEENRLGGDALIVDEASMIDLALFYALLKAVPPHMHLILVGDTNQLPSVGPGNVLQDIIESGVFPVVRLTRIFRQAQESRIVMNAHRINDGKYPEISNTTSSDFFFLEEEDADKAAELITDLVKRRLPKSYGLDPRNIQVLTPMQRGSVGSANLNNMLQSALNHNEDYLMRRGIYFRLDDKVMQIKNNYEKEVFNGDIGIVSHLDINARELSVRFDDREVLYDITELDELVHAYACTVHKSQGSEYPAVIMPVMMSHYILLQRNLIYTGITRAKKLLIIVGTKKALNYAIRNSKATVRNSRLKERIQQAQ